MTTKAGTNYLTEKEEKQLFRELRNRKERQAERDYVLIKLCRTTGMRRAEALSLNVGDVVGKTELSLDERIAKKGAVGHTYLTVEAQALIRRFLNLKRTWGESLDEDAPLFCSRLGTRLSLWAFNQLMTKWCKAAGIPIYSPHALRHTKAHRILDKAEDKQKGLLYVKKQLRHVDINTTTMYLLPTKEEMNLVATL